MVNPILEHANLLPGFQYDQRFIDCEAVALKEAIATLARRPLLPETLQSQKKLISSVAELAAVRALPSEIERNCENVALFLARVFELLGVWSVCYRGTLIYKSQHSDASHAFYFVNDEMFGDGETLAYSHSWVFTQAFPVLDLTAKYQQTELALRESLPKLIKIEQEDEDLPETRWYVPETDLEEIKNKWARLRVACPDFMEWNKTHRKCSYHSEAVSLEYIPMQITLYSKPIDIYKEITIGSESPVQFIKRFRRENG